MPKFKTPPQPPPGTEDRSCSPHLPKHRPEFVPDVVDPHPGQSEIMHRAECCSLELNVWADQIKCGVAMHQNLVYTSDNPELRDLYDPMLDRMMDCS
eukprot:3344615-Karenia_brevis.AAC.1